MLRSYKTQLDPNNCQRTLLRKHAGTARYAWNWALARVKNKESKPNAMQLHKEWNAWKKQNIPWWVEVSKAAPQESFRNLQQAFKNFFERRKDGVGFPKFKKKMAGCSGSFRLTGSICVESRRIKLPRLGWLRLKEAGYLPLDAHVLSATLSERAGRWFVSLSVQEEYEMPHNGSDKVVGIDVGVKTLATCSDGTTFENPKALISKKRQLGRLQRRHSRQKKGSNRREKTRQRIARLHYRISNIRRDAIHKATSWVVKTKRSGTVVLEDLSVSGMLKNHKLARAVADASVSEFRRQIEYKADWNGVNVELADRWFPSSKLCSECGCIKDDLKLSDRTYHCDGCGLSIDRDLNAAINLERYHTVSSTGIDAQGEGRLQGGVAAQCPSMN